MCACMYTIIKSSHIHVNNELLGRELQILIQHTQRFRERLEYSDSPLVFSDREHQPGYVGQGLLGNPTL